VTVTNPLEALGIMTTYTNVGYDDTSNAIQLTEHFGTNIKYVYPTTGFILFDGVRWQRNSAKIARNYAVALTNTHLSRVDKELAKAADEEEVEALKNERRAIVACRSQGRLDACLNVASSLPGIACDEDALDTCLDHFNTAKVTLHLHEPEQRVWRPNPADLLTKRSTVIYHPEAQCPTWERTIATILKEVEADIRYFQRWCGYAMTGRVREKAFLVLLGDTDTGKTTLMKTLKRVFGDYYAIARIQSFLRKGTEALTNDIAKLVGSRLVGASEVDEKHDLAEDTVKLITGGMPITARFLNKEEFEYMPQFKLFIDTNFMPRINAEDDALWGRMKVLKFSQKFVWGLEHRDRDTWGDALPMDKGLDEKLAEELSGILNWCIKGADMWMEEGLNTPTHIAQNTVDVRQKSDRYHAFLQEYCLPFARCKTQDLYDAYCHWCHNQANKNERYIPERDTFIEAMKKRGYVKKTDGSYQCFYGLCVKPSIVMVLGRAWYGSQADQMTARKLENETQGEWN